MRLAGRVGNRNGLARPGPPSGGPDRSIRKNKAPSGSGPSGLRYGRNGCVLSGVDRTGPPDGGPARVAQTGRVATGRRERGADRSARQTGGLSGESAATSLRGPPQRRVPHAPVRLRPLAIRLTESPIARYREAARNAEWQLHDAFFAQCREWTTLSLPKKGFPKKRDQKPGPNRHWSGPTRQQLSVAVRHPSPLQRSREITRWSRTVTGGHGKVTLQPQLVTMTSAGSPDRRGGEAHSTTGWRTRAAQLRDSARFSASPSDAANPGAREIFPPGLRFGCNGQPDRVRGLGPRARFTAGAPPAGAPHILIGGVRQRDRGAAARRENRPGRGGPARNPTGARRPAAHPDRIVESRHGPPSGPVTSPGQLGTRRPTARNASADSSERDPCDGVRRPSCRPPVGRRPSGGCETRAVSTARPSAPASPPCGSTAACSRSPAIRGRKPSFRWRARRRPPSHRH